MPCQILKHIETGEEFLVPDCCGVALFYHLDMPDRELIKEYCTCDRPKQMKYETKTKDEVYGVISKLKEKIIKMENDLVLLKNAVDGLQTEVFALNLVEVFIPDEPKKVN